MIFFPYISTIFHQDSKNLKTSLSLFSALNIAEAPSSVINRSTP